MTDTLSYCQVAFPNVRFESEITAALEESRRMEENMEAQIHEEKRVEGANARKITVWEHHHSFPH